VHNLVCESNIQALQNDHWSQVRSADLAHYTASGSAHYIPRVMSVCMSTCLLLSSLHASQELTEVNCAPLLNSTRACCLDPQFFTDIETPRTPSGL
jgi:hypothetical protein